MTEQVTLKAGGERTRVEEAEAETIAARFAEEIQAAQERQAVVTTVDLSCRAWPRASLEKLRSALTQVAKTVTLLKIDDIIASLPTDQGLESLEFFSDVFASSENAAASDYIVEEVDLNDNALGSRGDQVLLPLFSLPSVTKLYLENCGMSAEVAASLLNSLANKPLTAIKLGRNQIGAAGAAHVQTLLERYPTSEGQLEVFHYNGSRPLRAGSSAIAKGLAAMATDLPETGLVELNLYDCTFGEGDDDDGDDDEATSTENLAKVLAKSPKLKLLNLQDSELGSDGLQALLKALAEGGAKLTHLSLGGCELGTEGAEALATYAGDAALFDELVELVLDTNELGDEGVSTLVPALAAGAPKLQSLNLEMNELEKEGTVCLVKNKLPALQSLNVADNMDIPAKWGAKLEALYPEVKIDEDLEEGDDDDEEEVDELADQLSGTKI